MSILPTKVLLHLGDITTAFSDLKSFATKVQALVADTNLKAILATNPALAADVASVSAAWRTEEADEIAAARDKNLWSKLKAIIKAVADVNAGLALLGTVLKDPAVTAFLQSEQAAADPALTTLESSYQALSVVFGEFGESLPSLPAL